MLFKALCFLIQLILHEPLFVSVLHMILNTYLVTIVKKEVMYAQAAIRSHHRDSCRQKHFKEGFQK